jgi:acetolactate synthase I/II/III large subunit
MIMVGGGAIGAGAEIAALAEHLQAPVVSLRRGCGIVSDADPLGLTCAEGARLWETTDFVLGVGSRLELRPPG